MSKSVIKVSVVEGKFRVEISLEDLLFVAKHGDPGYEITDKKAFVKYLLNHFENTDYDQETGLGGMHRLIDRFFEEAYEDAEDWLHSPFLEDGDDSALTEDRWDANKPE